MVRHEGEAIMHLGIIGNPPNKSESEELTRISRILSSVLNYTSRVERGKLPGISAEEVAESVWHNVADAIDIVRQMEHQLKRGVHVNDRNVRRNGRAVKTSDNVMAVVYVHKDDGKFYCHGFGDADIALKSRGNALIIEGLKDRTDVQMFAEPDGSVRIAHARGEPIWEDIK